MQVELKVELVMVLVNFICTTRKKIFDAFFDTFFDTFFDSYVTIYSTAKSALAGIGT